MTVVDKIVDVVEMSVVLNILFVEFEMLDSDGMVAEKLKDCISMEVDHENFDHMNTNDGIVVGDMAWHSDILKILILVVVVRTVSV